MRNMIGEFHRILLKTLNFNEMKTLKLILSTLFLITVINCCEKEEEATNPFIGTWETTEITTVGSVVVTLIFRADMTLTYIFVTTINGASNTVSNNYTYSYTETKITVSQSGGQDEVSDYVINENKLTLSDNGADAVTFTKVN